MPRRTLHILVIGLLLASVSMVALTQAAAGFADPAFEQLWKSGEATTPNFWGPVSNAREGQAEPYAEGLYKDQVGSRLVQYFDKARMELTNPASPVSNGLLATELITGRVQMGDNKFEMRQPAVIPLAGDPDNTGPTYAALAEYSAALLAPAQPRAAENGFTTLSLPATGLPTNFSGGSTYPQANIAEYDDTTKHNVPRAFATFRQRVGIGAIGLAISEPFWSNVRVAGRSRDVLIQAFERRILTYTPDNPEAYQVEFGNIGQHYYQWRYQSANGANLAAIPGIFYMPTNTPIPPPAPLGTTGTARASVPVSFTTITTNVARGGFASATVQAPVGAYCKISVTYKSGQSAVDGLQDKVADANGRVSWTWPVGTNVTSGAAPVDVLCSQNNQSYMTSATITVGP